MQNSKHASKSTEKNLPLSKKIYTKPVLYHYGNLRGVTLAGSAGVLEKGGSTSNPFKRA